MSVDSETKKSWNLQHKLKLPKWHQFWILFVMHQPFIINALQRLLKICFLIFRAKNGEAQIWKLNIQKFRKENSE